MQTKTKTKTKTKTRLFIGLGANLTPDGYDTPREGCEAALLLLAEFGIDVLQCSHWYESAPVPMSDQPWYLNAVVEAVTTHDATKVMSLLHKIEAHFGRMRSVRNAPRVMDLDLLDFGGKTLLGDLRLPHPRLSERAFVLLPLFELCADWMHPQSRQLITELISSLPKNQLIRRVRTEMR